MNYKQCTKCVMDTTDPLISFDDEGVCNHCIEAESRFPNYKFSEHEERDNLRSLKKHIKSKQKSEYDSIIGLSGGVDSSYVAYIAMKLELNPLCVHFDNGWNSDIAVKNIRNIIKTTGFDFFTYVIDWPEFRDLQRAFFRAGVIDIEMLTDHAIFASLFKIRRRNNINIVLSGTNFATEHGLPSAWTWSKMDLRNIKSIQKKFGEMKIKSFPTMSTFYWLLMQRFQLGGSFEEPLNLINFKKHEAMEKLKEVFDWEYYGGKHYESVFTKFYQAYVLPNKFGVDKRKAHFSSLIRNGELSREQSLEELKEDLYFQEELIRDKEFVLKKLGFTNEEFEQIMLAEPVPHELFDTDQAALGPLIKLGKAIFGGRSG